ncbi:MAG: AbrB/MazE/SpoVT family DNA-binding domain-containing protein [Candidatus Pacebacteria bacterium]|nr:AbrB/MazE/SpoVT family DNA-binding domain-containing protein [Candidatus Paceibacterota bacterium]
METIIVKATSKGQITLPAKWRRSFNTNKYLLIEKKQKLEIKPLDMKKLEKKDEYTVFDAIRDNKGKGIRAVDLIKILEKTL